MGQTATNPKTGERVYLDPATNTWQPVKTATNPETGAKVFFDGTGWQPDTSAPAAPKMPPVQPLDPGESYDPNATFDIPKPPPDKPATQDIAGLESALTGMPGGFSSIEPGRAVKIGGQGALSGLTSLAMLPVDLPVLASKGLNWGFETGLGMAGRGLNRLFETGKFTYNPPPGEIPVPSEKVKEGASWAAKKLGYEPVVPETMEEKALFNIADFAAQGAGGGALLSKLAQARKLALTEPGALPRFGDSFLRPYMERPVNTPILDTAGGAGAGGAVTATQALPQEVREAGGGTVGAGADLLAMLAGGVSASQLGASATSAPTALLDLVRKNRPAANISVDPITGAAVPNKVADIVGKYMQGNVTTEPQTLGQSILRSAQGFKDQGLPLPTTGLLGETMDPGLAAIERRARTLPPTQFLPETPTDVRRNESFFERDRALKEAASENVQSISQPDVSREVIPAPAPAIPGSLPRQQQIDAELFARRAQERAAAEEAAREAQVARARGQAAGVQQARVAETQPVLASEVEAPEASRRLYGDWRDTRKIEQERSQGLWSNPDYTQHLFDISPVQRAAAEIRAETAQPGRLPVGEKTERILTAIEAAQDTGTLRGGVLSELNKNIEKVIAGGALEDAQDFQRLKELKDSIRRTDRALPQGHPAREAIEAARENTAEVTGPLFRRWASEVGDVAEKTNPGQVYPSKYGERALATGEDASQAAAIAAQRGTTPGFTEDARTVVFDQLAKSGVLKDGVFDPEKLTRWRNQNYDRIQHVPGLANEVDDMVARARRGEGLAAQHAQEIAAAEARLKGAQTAIEAGPVGKLKGQTPREAVDQIMNGKNSAAQIAELRARTGNSPDAVKSLKATIADHFIDRVTGIDPAVTSEQHAVVLRKLIDNFNDKRAAMVAAGFTPDEMQALQRAQTVLMPLLRRNVQATTGSITAENTAAAMRPLEMALKIHYGTLKGGSVFRNVKQGLALLKGDAAIETERLLTRAMFDPELAAHLLTRDVSKAGTPAWNAQLQKLIRRTSVAKDLAEPDSEE